MENDKFDILRGLSQSQEGEYLGKHIKDSAILSKSHQGKEQKEERGVGKREGE